MAPIDIEQSLENLKLERDAIALYDELARIEKDPRRADAFRSIARNEALRRLARQTLREDLYTEADAELLDGLPANQDVSLLAEIIDLRNAIAELAPRDALLLRLRYESDLTQGRLARVAGMPEGTVKIRLHRIRGRLRERLTGDND